ncbi:MAG: SdiA-regulated domain-containing protein [Bacteroidales bacterium]|jgi:uncharacterized protein YjiK|nr:SdiA-regulated domain-containing protein [Bacteroidales bacterium]
MNLFNCINSADEANPPSDDKSIKATGYNLSEPDRVIKLPPVLHEVSGIALIDSTSVACVQDENGVIFVVDLIKGEIRDQIFFHYPGDYEGLTRVGEVFYVLRSDGVLFRVLPEGSSGSLKKSYSVGIPPHNNEGLCYDRKNNRLLVVPKHNPGKESENDGKHPVYGFDLRSETLLNKPVLELNLKEIKKFAADNNIKSSGDDNKIRIRPSAVGIHPLTNDLYVLSASTGMLFVFDVNGRIKQIEKLDKDIFNMPEGISFFENGDMLISNEGRNKAPAILRFNYMLR